MARDKVELLVQLVGKDGVTKILDSAATHALKLDQRMKKGEKSSRGLSKSVKKIGASWAEVTIGLNQGLELFDKIAGAAGQVLDLVKQTAQQRQVEARFVNQLNVSVEAMRRASGFQLSDIELKQFSLQAQQAGVSMQQFEKLLNVALRASIATGKDFGEVFEGLFVDTVLGATDSYLEQLGIVKDLGKETEDYASKNFILKENIDKTTQSQAALNVVLTEVDQRFKGVKADAFITELARAAKAAEKIQDDLKKAGTFLVVDVLDALNITKVGKGGALDQLVKLQKEIEKLENAPAQKRVITAKGSARVQMLEANQRRIEEIKKQIGELAKINEEVRDVLFRDLSNQAEKSVAQFDQLKNGAEMLSEAFLKLHGNARLVEFEDIGTQAEKYDIALVGLAKSYGLADVAQQQFTTSAKQIRDSVRGFVLPAIGDASRAVIGLIRDFKSLSSGVLTNPLFQKGLAGDANALAEFFFGKKKTKPQKRRGGGRGGPSRAQIKKMQEGFLPKSADPFFDFERDFDTDSDFAAQNFMTERELAADNVKAFFEFEAVFAQIDALNLEIQNMPILETLEKLQTGFDGVAQAAQSMDSAVQSLGGSGGFANAAQQVQGLALNVLNFQKANEKTAGSYGQLAGSIVEASGQAALGFIEGEKERAGISAAMETARAGAAFAMFASTLSPNFAIAGSMHLVNAGLFAAIAGGAGASGGGGVRRGAGGSQNIPQFGMMGGNQQQQPAQIVVNMDGAIVAGANRRKTAGDLAGLVQESIGARR